MENKRPFFKHFVAEIYGVSFELCDSPAFIDKKVKKLLGAADIPIVKKQKYQFLPQGLSVVYILAASHLAIHTWPENGYLHLDLVTCSEETNFNSFEELLKREFPECRINFKILDY